MRHNLLPCLGLLILVGLDSGASSANEDTESFVRKSCAECHALSESSRNGGDFSTRADRTGPPLDFAGDKFRRDWLAQWLQAPIRLRPAGVFPPRSVVTDKDGKDTIDESRLVDHPALQAQDASRVADYMMTLRSREALVSGVRADVVSTPRRMGELNFSKFKGCIACHLDQPERGGVSGPELYTAWQRTTPNYLFSYIRDPAAWDRHALMPAADLNDAEIGKLLGYLRMISEEEQ